MPIDPPEYVSHVGSELRVDVDGNVGGANFVTVATSLSTTPLAISILYDEAAQATALAANF